MNIIDASNKTHLQVAQIVPYTAAEGPGQRFAIWVQGCPLRCPGCCNPEMLSFKSGVSMSIQKIIEQIDATREATKDSEQPLEGITFLGGEPISHASGASMLAEAVQQLGLTVMIFSGFTIEELRKQGNENVARLLSATDILVDGPYERERPDLTRRWIGSANQRIHFLTDRYTESDSSWDQQDTLEIRLEGQRLSVNGFPAKQAVGIWKRPRQK